MIAIDQQTNVSKFSSKHCFQLFKIHQFEQIIIKITEIKILAMPKMNIKKYLSPP
jgi:hypothetical protein